VKTWNPSRSTKKVVQLWGCSRVAAAARSESKGLRMGTIGSRWGWVPHLVSAVHASSFQCWISRRMAPMRHPLLAFAVPNAGSRWCREGTEEFRRCGPRSGDEADRKREAGRGLAGWGRGQRRGAGEGRGGGGRRARPGGGRLFWFLILFAKDFHKYTLFGKISKNGPWARRRGSWRRGYMPQRHRSWRRGLGPKNNISYPILKFFCEEICM
jgi:hypothetical protein